MKIDSGTKGSTVMTSLWPDEGDQMTESLKVRVDRRDGLAVIYTEGYINNQGGEEIAARPPSS